MRVRYKPWAEDYLKGHPELVDMDGQHAGKMTEWFDKTQPIHIEIGSGMGQFITTLAAQILILTIFQWNVRKVSFIKYWIKLKRWV